MAFDGITVAAICHELKETILDCHISKIAQPEKDELILTIKGSCGQKRLLISANASLPLMYFTENNKPSPMTAPNFCMLLRKFIANGKIIDITQPGLERIIVLHIEHLDELGDLRKKRIYVELMGKHSNIIFTDDEDKIIDSIKHIPSSVSSVREVLPGREYFIPNTMDKQSPFEVAKDEFKKLVFKKPMDIAKAVYTSFTGISPVIANEIAFRAGLDGGYATASIVDEAERDKLFEEFNKVTDQIKAGSFSNVLVIDKEEGAPVEFAAVNLSVYSSYQDKYEIKDYESVSLLLEDYYRGRELYGRIRQKSVDLRRIVSTVIERDVKKLDIQKKQLKDTEKRDKYKLYGELLLTYAYGISEGEKKAKVNNYYTGEDIEIPLDETLSAVDNSKKYYEKYNKLKRTREALEKLTKETEDELYYLESVSNALDIAVCEDDLSAIKDELTQSGFIKKHGDKGKKKAPKSKPFHYVSSDGFDIFVGKNNIQNDELTFKVAEGGDWWFHSKKIPGSHVIVKTGGRELTDRCFEEAAAVAAFYSKAKDNPKVEIDYVLRKEVKKPSGAAPGFVVYYTNYSMTIEPSLRGVTLVE